MIKPPSCPICHKLLVGEAACRSEFFPFCSERCRRVDFFRWNEGKYAIEEPLSPIQLAEELEQSRAELEERSGDSDP
jgi:uncharacterized protein